MSVLSVSQESFDSSAASIDTAADDLEGLAMPGVSGLAQSTATVQSLVTDLSDQASSAATALRQLASSARSAATSLTTTDEATAAGTPTSGGDH